MNFNCDVCGREMLGCTFVNGMKFCAKCYQETFGETEKDRKIADLEAKLAEKEKEIEKLNACVKFYKSYYISFNEKVIDELEKVKNKIESKVESIYKILDDLNIKIVGESTPRELSTYKEIVKEIDNQIKQLKEMMKSE